MVNLEESLPLTSPGWRNSYGGLNETTQGLTEAPLRTRAGGLPRALERPLWSGAMQKEEKREKHGKGIVVSEYGEQ